MEATINCQLVTNILQNILFKSDCPFKRKSKWHSTQVNDYCVLC